LQKQFFVTTHSLGFAYKPEKCLKLSHYLAATFIQVVCNNQHSITV